MDNQINNQIGLDRYLAAQLARVLLRWLATGDLCGSSPRNPHSEEEMQRVIAAVNAELGIFGP